MMIPQLIFTRFAAIMLIVFFHYASGVYPVNAHVILTRYIHHGDVSVSYFFVLSGFVMTVSYYNRVPLDLRKYLISRFARIYPVYFLTLLCWLIPFINKSPDSNESLKILLNILLLQSWVPTFPQTFNYPAWFLSVLVFFYIIFPMTLKYFKSKKGTAIVYIISGIWILSIALTITSVNHFITVRGPSIAYDLTFYHPFMHVSTFLVGIGGGILYLKKYKSYFHDKSNIMIFSSLVILFIVFSFNIPIAVNPYYKNGLLSPVLLMLIIGLSSDKTVISRALSNRLFILLGNISFSIYVLHVPLRIVIDKLLHIDITSSLYTFSAYLIVLIISSAVVHSAIEKPVRNYIVDLNNKHALRKTRE